MSLGLISAKRGFYMCSVRFGIRFSDIVGFGASGFSFA